MRDSPTPRLAFVTGAGIRVGRAIAVALADAGYDLLLHANRSRRPLDELAAELEARGVRTRTLTADLSSTDEVERLADELERAAEDLQGASPSLDLLVHNAAIFERIPFADIRREDWRRMLAINLEAPFFLTQRLLPLLERGEDPQVVHIGDVGGERPVPEYAHYSVSKAGLLMLTRALAVELAPRIRVNAVSPGTVAFPPDFDEAARAEVLERIPMGREGSPEDIAGAVRYLADARYVTGQMIAVDGGRSVPL